MSKTRNRYPLAIPSIGLAILGIFLIVIEQRELGLTSIFLSALLMSGTFIRNRLEKIGSELWAVGSLIVWIGFFLFAFPLLAYAWNISNSQTQLIFLISGIILMIIGFTTEYFDLNIKIINFWHKTYDLVLSALQKIRKRLFHSIWNGISTISIILLIITFIFQQDIETDFKLDILIVRLTLVAIILICFLIEFHEFIFLLLNRTMNFTSIILQGILRRIKELPDLLISLSKKLKSFGVYIVEEISSFINFNLNNTYIIGFSLSIIFAIIWVLKQLANFGSLTILSLLISLGFLISQEKDIISDRLSGIQQYTYKQSLRVRNLVKREKYIYCEKCKYRIRSDLPFCVNCHAPIPNCMVCRGLILIDDPISRCPFCEQIAHSKHLDSWLKIKPICPNCRSQIENQQ